MGDSDYLISIIVELVDRAGPKLAKLKGEIDSLKSSRDSENALDDLGGSIENAGKDAEKSEGQLKKHREEQERGGKSAQNLGRDIKSTSKDLDDHSRATSAASRSQGNLADSIQKSSQRFKESGGESNELNKKMKDLLQTQQNLRKEVNGGNGDLRDARLGYVQLGKDLQSLSVSYDRASNSAKILRKAAEDSRQEAQRLQSLQSSSRGPISVSTAIQKQARDIENLDRVTAGYYNNLKKYSDVEKSEIAARLSSRYKSASRGFEETSPEAIRLTGVSRALNAESSSIKNAGVDLQDLANRYEAFDKLLKTGDLSKGDTRRGLESFRKEARSAANDLDSTGDSFKRAGSLLGDIDKKLKNVKATSTGFHFIEDLENSLKGGESSSSTGKFFEYLDSHIGSLGVRITGVSSFLRGFMDLAKVAFAQPLITGLISIAGSLVSVGAAAAQAGAALAGAFISGVAQVVPMVSIAAAAMMRFKSILQAVSLNNEAEKASFFEPHAGEIKTLQNQSQLISSQQQLVNSNIQLYDAQERVKLSQISLTESRVNAIRNITNLELAEKSAKLAAEGASISMVEARRQLQTNLAQGDVTGVVSAELQVKNAELAKKKAEIEVPRSEYESRVARERGVSGAPTVISAVEGAKAASQAVVQARQAADAARREMKIIELELSQPASKETSQQAQLQYLYGQMSAPEKVLTKVLTSMDKELRSPNSPLKKITDYFISPFTEIAQRLQSLLHNNSFIKPIDELAKAMGAAFKKYGNFVFGEQGTSFFKEMAKDAKESLPIVTEAIIGIMKLFEDIAKAAAPAFKKLSEDWRNFWGTLDKKYEKPGGMKGLEEFFNKSVHYAEAFAGLGKAIVELFMALGHDAAPEGLKTVTSFTGSIESATNWVKSHGPEVTKFFREAREGLSLIGGVLFTIGKELLRVFSSDSLRAFSSLIRSIILPALGGILIVTGFIIKKFVELINIFAPIRIFFAAFAAFIGVSLGIVKLVAIVKTIIKTFIELKAVIEAIKLRLILLSPWSAIGGAIIAATILAQKFSNKQKEVKVSADEVKESLEDQARILREINSLNEQYKSSELTVKESKTQLSSSELALRKIKGEHPAKGESKEEYDIRKLEAEHQVERAKLSYSSNVESFRKLPSEQREEHTKDIRASSVDEEKARARVKEIEPRVKHGRELQKSGEYSTIEILGREAELSLDPYEPKAEKKNLIKEEKELAEARDELSKASSKTSEIIKAGNKIISESTNQAADVAPKLSHAYNVAYGEFEESVRKGEVAAGKGMGKIRELVDRALKKYGVSSAEIKGSQTVIVHGREVPTNHAAGGYIPATSGGVHARVAEGGHDEVVLSTDPAHAARSRSLLGQYLQKAPHMAEGGPVRSYQSPLHGGYQITSEDMGIDLSLSPGSPITAIGDSKVMGILQDWYGPQPFIWAQLLNGPDKGKYYYAAEQITKLAKVGAELKAGQPLAYYAGAGTGVEMGWATASGQTLAQASGEAKGEIGSRGTKAGAGFKQFITALQQGKVIAGEASEIFHSITAPKIKGGGAIGAVAQNALDIVTAGANKYLEKHMKMSGGPSGAGGAAPKGQVTNWLTQALKITKHFSQANLSSLYGRTMQESSGNPLSINLTDSNALAGHPSKGLLQTIPETFKSYELAGHGNIWNPVDNAIAAIRYMFARYGHIVGPSGSGYAMGGMIGDHVRRLAVRHLRKKLMGFSSGGRAPWGGEPIPIIAHAGERVMNPNQYAEASRPWGGSHSLDSHLGFNSTPRQHFAGGGIPGVRHPGGTAQKTTTGNIAEANEIKRIGKIFSSFQKLVSATHIEGGFTAEEISSVKNVVKIIEGIKKAFKKLSGISKDKRAENIYKIVGDIEKEVFPRLEEGFETLKRKVASKIAKKSYLVGSKGEVKLNIHGQVGIERQKLEGLHEETKYIKEEIKVAEIAAKEVGETAKKIKDQLKKSKPGSKKQTGEKKELAKLESAYGGLAKKRRELSATLDENIESTYQTETSKIQAELTEAEGAYQVTSQKRQTKLSSAQERGNYSQVASIDKETVEAAEGQKVALQSKLSSAQGVGNTELARQIEEQISSIEQTINQAVIEQLTSKQSEIQQKFQAAEAKESSEQSIAQALGNFSVAAVVDEHIKNTAVAKKGELEGLLANAKTSGDTALQSTLEQEIAALETTISTTIVNQISAAKSLIQREAGEYQSESQLKQSLSKVAQAEGKFTKSGELEREGLGITHSGLLSTRAKDEQLLGQASAGGDTQAVVELTEELRKNSAEIEENSLALKENYVTTRELIINQIEQKAQFSKGIYSSLSQGIEIIGKITGATNVKALLGAAEGEKGVLGNERGELEGEAGGIGLGAVQGMNAEQILTWFASPTGQETIKRLESTQDPKEKEQMYKIVNSLESNSIATEQNTEKIAELNGHLNQPQTWSTQAFQQFGASFFNGMGNLLPSVIASLPAGSRPENMPVYGTGATTNSGTTIGKISLTHPVEKLDPGLMGEELGYHMNTAPTAAI